MTRERAGGAVSVAVHERMGQADRKYGHDIY